MKLSPMTLKFAIFCTLFLSVFESETNLKTEVTSLVTLLNVTTGTNIVIQLGNDITLERNIRDLRESEL